jgi:hypothetical protein
VPCGSLAYFEEVQHEDGDDDGAETGAQTKDVGPEVKYYNSLFSIVAFKNKLECLNLESIFSLVEGHLLVGSFRPKS